MTTRTRASKTDDTETPAAPAEGAVISELVEPAAESNDPADEAQTSRAPEPDAPDLAAQVAEMRETLAANIGTVRANGDRHNVLVGKLDELAAAIAAGGGAEGSTELAAAELDLSELHDRFDLLGSQIDELGRADRTGNADEPARSAAPAVLAQVLAVMREVHEIGKGGTAPQVMGGYRFRKVDDAIDAVGNAMRRVGVVLRSEVTDVHTFARKVASSSGPRDGWGCRVTMRYVFVSPQDGSEHAIEGVGEGADAGDKATSKATSMALKYALLQGLMIPVEGVHLDVENEDTRPQDEPRGQRQQGSAYDRATEAQRDAYHRGEQMPEGPSPRTEREAPPRDEPPQDPPELQAVRALKWANEPGRTRGQLSGLLDRARNSGLNEQQIEWFGATASLQQHLVAAIRLAAPNDEAAGR